MNTINYWERAQAKANPFELPHSITKRLHEFSRKQSGARPERIKYLWVYISDSGVTAPQYNGSRGPELGVQEWLNVVDEAASLGAEWLVMCVGSSLSQHSEVWQVCEWAQAAHGMFVGVHIANNDLAQDDIRQISKLDPEKTHLLVSQSSFDKFKSLEDEGISIAVGDVTSVDHTPPCDYPESMVCVGPKGHLYTCGLVLGDERFCLGSIMDRPLKRVVDDKGLPHVVPQHVCYQEHGCDACPPFVVERMLNKQHENEKKRESSD